MDPFTDLYVVSPDTDVLLLLIYYYPQLCANTTFRTGSGNDQRDIEIRKMYESIDPLHAKDFTSLQDAIRLVAFMENQN